MEHQRFAGIAYADSLGFGIENNIATCKKYFNDSKQNCIILQPANDKYSPIIINEYNYHEFKIIGKLALVISKRN